MLVGMLLAATDHRPAHLTRARHALASLPEDDRRRLGVLCDWPTGPHELSYRQLEHAFARIVRALAKPVPDGTPSEHLSQVVDGLLEASVQAAGPPAGTPVAVDRADHETFSRPPPRTQPAGGAGTGEAADAAERPTASCADPEASWGHRRPNAPGAKDHHFFGYHLQVATMTKDENGPQAPELVRRLLPASCRVDPPAALVGVLGRMTEAGIPLADVLADSGHGYRKPEHWALPLRRLGANLVVDLHPNDRGPRGTHMGATAGNGNLYCPATPTSLLELGPLGPAATRRQTAAHDQQTAELARHKLGRVTRPDKDGYHRVACPATQGKLRCPLRPRSATLPHDRPEILDPPRHPPACRAQQTLTVPASVNAKTAQKHDYPSAAHRRSYKRRTAAERAYATSKDPATTDTSNKGWCRLAGLTARSLLLATALVARNLRVTDAYQARQADDRRRQAAGQPPKTRTRRRTTSDDIIAAGTPPP